MRITILAFGSQGDVRPILAVGAGLRAAGHQVRLATDHQHEGLVRSAGVEFFPAAGDIHAMLQGASGERLRATGGNPLRLARTILREMRPTGAQLLRDCWNASQGADALLLAGPALMIGSSIAAKLGIPFVQANLLPMTPTRAFPSPLTPMPLTPTGWLGGAFNLLTYHLVAQGFWQSFRPLVNAGRRELFGASPISIWSSLESLGRGSPMLYGFSPSVIPQPTDWTEPVRVTGYWFLDHSPDWRPSEHLLAFLEAGPPPVYVGFGSMSVRDPEETTTLIVRALALAGQRGVLLTGWGGMSEGKWPESVYVAESIPHDWLFPRMAAVVHHGGAGTTAAGLRAGVTSVLVPFFADQPFWARRVMKLGVGPAPIPRRQLTAERLAAAITAAIRDEDMRRRARALGAHIRAEDGVGEAVRLIEAHVNRASRRIPM